MLKNESAHTQLAALQQQQSHAVEIPDALPLRLQVLDLARHTVIAPDGKRYVVATFDDRRVGRNYVTAIYPQQNDYLTLVRLTIAEFSSATLQEAIQRHISVVQAIQQGEIRKFGKTA
jgi:hypothetical protein